MYVIYLDSQWMMHLEDTSPGSWGAHWDDPVWMVRMLIFFWGFSFPNDWEVVAIGE